MHILTITRSLNEYFHGNIKDSMFYLGAACHLIQDLTVPQHANVHLLNNHKSYENWVIRTHRHHDEFKIEEGGISGNSLKHYIDFNSKEAINIYRKHSHVQNRQVRFQHNYFKGFNNGSSYYRWFDVSFL